MAFGDIVARFRLDTKEATSSAAKLGDTLNRNLNRSLQTVAGGAGNLVASLGSVSVAAAGAAAAVGAVTMAARMGVGHVIRLGDQITTLSAQTGLSTDFLQKLKFASNELDFSFEGAVSSISKFQKYIGQANPTKEFTDALDLLNLNVKDLKRLNPEQAFLKVAAAINETGNQYTKANVAQTLFGRTGAQLLPAFASDIDKVMQKASDLGLVLDRDLLEAGDELGENWQVLKDVGMALLANAVAPLVEGLTKLTASTINAISYVKNSDAAWIGWTKTLWKYTTPLGLIIEGHKKLFGLGGGDGGKGKELLGKVTANISRQNADAMEAEAAAAEAASKAAEKLAKSREKLLKGFGKAYGGGVEARQDAYYSDQVSQTMQQTALTPTSMPDLLPFGVGDGQVSGQEIVDSMVVGVGDLTYATEQAKKRQEEYNDALQNAASLVSIIPGKLGEVVGLTVSLTGSISKLSSGPGGIMGSFTGAFQQGSGGKTGIMGMLGGIGGVIGAAGPWVQAGLMIGGFVAKGLKKLFGGRSGDTVMKEAARDMGTSISKELADSIHASGKNVQTAIADIFKEGNMSVDRFAEEVGDIFSALEQGNVSQPEAITALEESIPLLIQNFEELGPAGQEQIDRIIAAAERLGIEFEGLDELMQATFAPSTMEEMAAAFGLTNDQVRQMGERLGIDIQTNLERVAASVGLTASEFKTLGEAMETQLGIPAEQLQEFLEATGLSASALAQQLGVEVGAGAQVAADAQALANERLAEGGFMAGRLADELERAARASNNIHLPSSGVPKGAKGMLAMATGGVVHGATNALIGEGGAEVVAPVKAVFGSLGDSIAAKVAAVVAGGKQDNEMAELNQAVRMLPQNIGRAVKDAVSRAI